MKLSYKRIGSKGSGRGKRHGLLYGLIVSIGIFLTAVTGIALLVSNSKLGEGESSLIAGFFYGAAVFAGCYLTVCRSTGSKLLQSAIIAIACLILLIGSIYATPGTHDASVGRLFGITAAAWLGSGLLGTRKKRNGFG